MKTSSFAHTLLIGALRAALVLALVGAVWSVYRQLPDDARSGEAENEAAFGDGETRLRIVLRVDAREIERAASGVELYSIDVAGATREFNSERRAGARIEDFLRQRMNGRAPLTVRFDTSGEATVVLAPGRWWVHATHADGAQELMWRLPVRVAGREQTVVLTPENAYMRTQSF